MFLQIWKRATQALKPIDHESRARIREMVETLYCRTGEAIRESLSLVHNGENVYVTLCFEEGQHKVYAEPGMNSHGFQSGLQTFQTKEEAVECFVNRYHAENPLRVFL